jgi:hypothetical protein
VIERVLPQNQPFSSKVLCDGFGKPTCLQQSPLFDGFGKTTFQQQSPL